MKRTKTEGDGSFSYNFTPEDIKQMIMEKHPLLIDDKHKFHDIDFSNDDIAYIIVPNCCGKLIYKDDTIKCGEWSGGDQHFCKECSVEHLNEQEKKDGI